MAYTADINIVVKGQAAVNSLQKSLIEVGEKLDELTKKRIGPAATLETFSKQLREARSRLDEVVAGTSNETAAIKNYVTALGNANAASERQNRLISDEIKVREAATGQLEKLIARQQDFIARTDAAAQAAHRQTAEFIRQQRIAKELAKINANAPAPQLLLAPAAPGSPAMSGGARSLITGPVERLGGARTQDQADMALRFAQALKEQVRPLTQIQALYAGIASEAAAMQRVKALPDAAMLNAASRGIKSLETGQDRYNRELAESAERLQQLDRLEASRARRAEKLRQIADYYGTPSAMANAGFGVQGPAMPPGGIRKPSASGAKGGLGFNPAATAENLALGAGFPLLFGGGVGQVAGGLAGSFFGQGFGGQILGSAIGQQLEDAIRRITEIGTALDQLNMDALRDSVLLVNSELTNQVRLLQEAGRADEARAAIAKEVALQTGLLPEAVNDITNNTTLLGNTWNEFVGAVSGTLAILGAPFASALTFILQGLAKALQGINIIATGLASILKSAVEWAAKTLGLGGLLENVKNQTTAISEEEQKRVATLQKLTDSQIKEIQNNQTNLQLEAQRTLGRNTAEKQINAQIDSQLAKEKIRIEYADKAKALREEYGNVTSAAGKRELELALQANEALKQQALDQQKIKDLLAQQATQIEANTEKYSQAAEAVQRQIAALDRGNAVTQSRYNAELALNDLYGVQLQRQYELATTAQQRFDIAIAMFQQQIKAAQIEYEQALNNNVLLVEKAKLEANLVEIKYKQLEAEKAIAIAQAQSRGNTSEQIKSIADAYDRGLRLQQDAVQAAYDQVQATVDTANNQNKVADAVYKTKVIQAESNLAQKLVSDEIGMSEEQAQKLAGSLASGVFRANEMSSAMYNVAQQASNAAQQIQNAINLQNMLRGGGDQNAGAAAAYAQGGYVTGPTRAVIGEGGESEYVIPASKMSAAMARYASGQRGDSVIPGGNTAGAPSGDMGSTSINPMINVTTGPVMNMNGSNYVSQRDFVAGMQAASRRGAEMALSAMRTNGGVRRAIGVR